MLQYINSTSQTTMPDACTNARWDRPLLIPNYEVLPSAAPVHPAFPISALELLGEPF